MSIALRTDRLPGIVAILSPEIRPGIPVRSCHKVCVPIAIDIPDRGSLRHKAPGKNRPLVRPFYRIPDFGSSNKGNEDKGEKEAQSFHE